MIYPNTTDPGGGSLYPRKTPTSSKNAWNALLNAIGINLDRPVIGGKRVTATLNFPNTLAQTSSDLTITCAGAAIGDFVLVGGALSTANTCFTGHVAAAGIVTIRFNNYSSGAINPASAVFSALVIPSGL